MSTIENDSQEELIDKEIVTSNDQDISENQSDNDTEENSLAKELTAEKDKFIRLFAEFENYKKRTQKERSDLFKTANQEVLLAMLPVCDDFDRAIAQLEKIENLDSAILDGMILIQNKLFNTLKSKGLEKMNIELGTDFNTDFHEAITQIPAPNDTLKGKIIDVVETGYTLNNKVIRYAKVIIGN